MGISWTFSSQFTDLKRKPNYRCLYIWPKQKSNKHKKLLNRNHFVHPNFLFPIFWAVSGSLAVSTWASRPRATEKPTDQTRRGGEANGRRFSAWRWSSAWRPASSRSCARRIVAWSHKLLQLTFLENNFLGDPKKKRKALKDPLLISFDGRLRYGSHCKPKLWPLELH